MRKKLAEDVLLCRGPREAYWVGTRAQWLAARGPTSFADWKVTRLVPKAKPTVAERPRISLAHCGRPGPEGSKQCLGHCTLHPEKS